MELLFLCIIAGIIVNFLKKRKIHKQNIRNLKKCISVKTNDEIDTIIMSVTDDYNPPKGDYNFVYHFADMPLGRATAFLNYHNTNIYDEEPYIFLCKRSLKDNEFREYGCIVGRNGIYISTDNPENAKLGEKQAARPGKEISIMYNGLTCAKVKGKRIHATYIRSDKKTDKTKKVRIENDSERDLILKVLNQVVAQNIGLSFYKELVVENIDQIPEALTKTFGSVDKAHNYYKKEKQRAEKKLKQHGINKGFVAAGIQSSKPQFAVFYNENKQYMDGSRGHGYAAEYGNNTVDRFFAKDVENAAQQLENGHQIKSGADRIVDGIEIQTKYCKTAADTIAAAFENKQAKYIRTDGSGKMMAIEVPKDQYHDAIRLMQERIDNNQVPNVEPGESAEKYVRKGHFTYKQSFMIAKSGTIESLQVDIMSGVVCCSQAAGITAMLTFALAMWNGLSIEEAIKQSLRMGIKVLGKGAMIYTLTMQLSRKNANNIFGGFFNGQTTFENPAYVISENLSKNLNTSSLAQTQLGKAMGLDTINGRQLIGGAVTVAVVFGPDIARALVGRISPKQLAKNATVGAAGLAGAAIGQTIIPIPIVGGMIGGAVSSFIAKKTLDLFVEDDAKEMFRILKEEFIDTTMLAGLTHEEFEMVVKSTIAHPKLAKMLQKMYQSQTFRRYARDEIMMPAINDVLKKREIIIEVDYEEQLKLLAANN